MRAKELNEEELAPYQFPIEDKSERIIKVIGVGGGGGNAVQHMWEAGVKNVTFLVTNTDAQVLKANLVPNKVQLGPGLGTGGKPELGRGIAEESVESIKAMFDDDTKMVFVMAGMGGGTGTGAGPVIARVAKELGILTVGVVTLPFRMEGKRRIDQALRGMEELKKCVDSLIVINNEKLLEHEQYHSLSWEEGMKKADEVLTIATRTIAEIITERGIINRDYNDVRTVMKDGGAALVSVAKASGEKRLLKAMSEAVRSPLIANVNTLNTKRLLYIVYSGSQSPAMMDELRELNEFMENFDENIEVLWGHYRDESLGDEIKVSIVATGFDDAGDVVASDHLTDEQKRADELRHRYYDAEKKAAEEAVPSEENVVQEETSDVEGAVDEVPENEEGSAVSEDVETDTDEEVEAEGECPQPRPSIFKRLVEKLSRLVEEDM